MRPTTWPPAWSTRLSTAASEPPVEITSSRIRMRLPFIFLASANSGGRRTTSEPWMSPRFFRRSSTSDRSSAFTVSLAAPAMAQPLATNRCAFSGTMMCSSSNSSVS